jgi:hypothetical protein
MIVGEEISAVVAVGERISAARLAADSRMWLRKKKDRVSGSHFAFCKGEKLWLMQMHRRII